MGKPDGGDYSGEVEDRNDEWDDGQARVEAEQPHLWSHTYWGALWWHKGKLGKVVSVERRTTQPGRHLPIAVVLAEVRWTKLRASWVVWNADETRLMVLGGLPVPVG